jgi:hypothetical protein
MDVATLKQEITTTLKSSPFQTSGAALASAPVTTLLTAHLGSDSLQLTGAAQTGETDTTITVQGTLGARVHGLTGLTAAVTFTVANGTAQASVLLTGLPAGWTPSQSFPTLGGTTFDAFTYASPSLTLDSQDAPILPSGFPGSFGLTPYSSDLTAAQVRGLGMQATVTPTADLGVLTSLLGGSSWTVDGPIALDASLPSILLASEPQPPFSIAGFDIPFGLQVVSAILEGADGTLPPAPITFVQLSADVKKDVGAPGAPDVLDIPVTVRTSPGQAGVLLVESELGSALSIGFDQITHLIAGASTAGQIPDLFPALDDIQLQSISVAVQPAAADPLLSVGATVAFAPGSGGSHGWAVFDGLIVFQGLDVTLTWFPELDSVTTQVECSAVLAGGTLEAGIDLPSMDFYCKLKEGTSISITDLVKQVSGGSISMPQVNCTRFAIFGSVPDSQYRFQATVNDDWTFSLGGSKPFGLTQVGMDLTYGPGLSGEVVGTFVVAGAELEVGAAYDSATPPWTFTGGTVGTQNISITDLVADVLSLFAITLPANAPQLTLTNLNISFTTPTHDFEFTAMSSLEVLGTTFDFGVEISRSSGTTTFKGYLWIGADAFEFDFIGGGGSPTVLAGSWTASDESGVLDLRAILSGLRLDLSGLPSVVDLTLAKALVVYDLTNRTFALVADSEKYGALAFASQAASTGTLLGFALEATVTIGLSDLPLVGAQLASIETVEVSDFQISATSQPMGPAGATLNGLLKQYQPFYPGGLVVPVFPTLPAGGTTEVVFSATLRYGTGSTPLYVPLDGGSVGGSRQAPAALPAAGGTGTGAGTSAGMGTTGVVEASTSTPDGTLWFTLEKSFGPLTLQRIGLHYQSTAQTLWFELDASLGFGPLTLSLMGLGIGSPLTSFEPTFGLDGVGVGYSEPPLTVSGALLNLSPPDGSSVRFEGEVVVGTGEFSVEALAYYGTTGGFPSMFIFVDVSAALGGPPAFFVTGVAGGFGYNSWINVPTAVSQVPSFPFLAFLPGSTTPQPGIFGGSSPTPTQVLQTLTTGTPPWVAPTAGSLWVAAGVTFTSFELVHSQALLVVEAGQDLIISLLGTSRAQFPQAGGALYANVELDLEARLAPLDGVFSIEAVLSPASFLLDRACVLTGGFAFYVWFGNNAHAGDFVLTVGGYHPAFVPPDYYPQVPRVGFHWNLDASINVRGGAYFALTPSVLMAGGELDVTYQSGNLKAWLTAHADALVRWKPFWFDLGIGITVGASYTVNLLFTSHTFSVELGCDLELWGPPTGGVVRVDWAIISFSICFGAERNPDPAPLAWPDVQAMLPNSGTQATPNVLSLNAAAGLVSTLQPPSPPAAQAQPAAAADADDARPTWVVRGSAFTFSTAAPIPASTLAVGETQRFAGDAFDVHPLGWTGVNATHEVTFTDGKGADLSAAFTVTPTRTDVPASLWGSPPESAGTPQVPSGTAQLVPQQLSGVTLQVNPPSLGTACGPVDVAANLAAEDLGMKGALLPVSASAQPAGDLPVNGLATVSRIASTTEGIAAPAAAGARAALFSALRTLGYGPASNDDMTDFADTVGCALTAEPLLVA